jgi:hypothetical protein
VLSVFKRLIPIPTPLKAKDKYRLNIDQVRLSSKRRLHSLLADFFHQVKKEILDLSLHVILASNRQLVSLSYGGLGDKNSQHATLPANLSREMTYAISSVSAEIRPRSSSTNSTHGISSIRNQNGLTRS